MPNWKGKTCEKCEYRDGQDCRRFPPNIEGLFHNSYFPDVAKNYKYSSACGEYEEEKYCIPIYESHI